MKAAFFVKDDINGNYVISINEEKSMYTISGQNKVYKGRTEDHYGPFVEEFLSNLKEGETKTYTYPMTMKNGTVEVTRIL